MKWSILISPPWICHEDRSLSSRIDRCIMYSPLHVSQSSRSVDYVRMCSLRKGLWRHCNIHALSITVLGQCNCPFILLDTLYYPATSMIARHSVHCWIGVYWTIMQLLQGDCDAYEFVHEQKAATHVNLNSPHNEFHKQKSAKHTWSAPCTISFGIEESGWMWPI